MRRLALLSLTLPITMLMSTASFAETKLDSSILSFDGKEFVRTDTTLTQDGQSAVGTKLDHDSPAYKALVEKHSYTGPATVFGKNYQGNYAPLIGADGKVTGALFVGIAK
jgi:methyl-accepting chemotaxis protein